MSKMSKKELSAMGSKIMAKAKAIRKEHPNKKWQSCVKEAGKACKKNNVLRYYQSQAPFRSWLYHFFLI